MTVGRALVTTTVAIALAGCSYIGAKPTPNIEMPSPVASLVSATDAPSIEPAAEGFVSEADATELILQCGVGGHVAAYFRISAGNDYRDHFPEMGRSPEIEGVSDAFVVVYDDPVTAMVLGAPGASREPLTNAVCVIPPSGYPIVYGNVSRVGMALPPGAYVAAPAHSAQPTAPSSSVSLAEAIELPMYGSEPIVDPLRLSISNGTTLVITLVVNGQSIGPFGPRTHEDPIEPSLLPTAPWFVEARTPSGRVLVTMDVAPGDVWHTTEGPNGSGSSRSAGARADLSCGRLDVWSGAPMGGPAPQSSFPPGDCDL